MRVVLYADDMEPITVLELPQVFVDYIERHRYERVMIPVIEPMPMAPLGPEAYDRTMPAPKIVEIRVERLRRNGAEHLVLFTPDEEAALMLRSELLPGQRKDAQERESQQYARGFLFGLAHPHG